jgi:hypothetical protein
VETDLETGAITPIAALDMTEPTSLVPANAWWAAAVPPSAATLNTRPTRRRAAGF